MVPLLQIMHLTFLATAAWLPPPRATLAAEASSATNIRKTVPAVTWVNPLEYDGFTEPGGWSPSRAGQEDTPLLVFLPGMDGSLVTPFMQYPNLGTCFEIMCLRHTNGLKSRATFDDLVEECTEFVGSQLQSGRQVLLVGESFGGTLSIATALKLQEEKAADKGGGGSLAGLVLVNPATSYDRSRLAKVAPVASALPLPLYALSLLVLAALVLTPQTQAPAFLSMLASQKIPTLLARPHREAFLGRVALSVFLGVRGEGLGVADVLAVDVFSPEELGFRTSQWLQKGAAQVNQALVDTPLKLPVLAVVGDQDNLLPSVDEAARLRGVIGGDGGPSGAGGEWRGTVVVPGAGHASTLGNRVDLLEEIRTAFEDTGGELRLSSRESVPQLPAGNPGTGWDRFMLDRNYPGLDPKDYTRYVRGGDLSGLAGLAPLEEAERQ